MRLVLLVSATLAGIVHVLFFVLESFLFDKPAGRKAFGTTEPEAAAMKFLAFNQGFYNLFLALGAFAGVALVVCGRDEAGRAIVGFACACMAGAAAVLATGGKKFARGVVAQSAAAVVALVALALG